jgi:hypothetical protein
VPANQHVLCMTHDMEKSDTPIVILTTLSPSPASAGTVQNPHVRSHRWALGQVGHKSAVHDRRPPLIAAAHPRSASAHGALEFRGLGVNGAKSRRSKAFDSGGGAECRTQADASVTAAPTPYLHTTADSVRAVMDRKECGVWCGPGCSD